MLCSLLTHPTPNKEEEMMDQEVVAHGTTRGALREYYAQTRTADDYATDYKNVMLVKYRGETGTARRHPDDEFDFSIGFNLALARAMEAHATKVAAEARELKRITYDEINRRSCKTCNGEQWLGSMMGGGSPIPCPDCSRR